MSSEHDNSTRGGSLEDIHSKDVEVEGSFKYNLQQIKRHWKAIGTILATALTSYAVYWVEGAVTIDVLIFGAFTLGVLVYTILMIRSDMELE
jgi:hypothetical protein